ncbi:MAG: hypothetical protein Q9220_002784 [cf. Caloplaca sp. 1 TL-2023]
MRAPSSAPVVRDEKKLSESKAARPPPLLLPPRHRSSKTFSAPSFFLMLKLTSHRYLIPGLAQDDIYIMVEDEFLSTASLFTSHLHHAEYVRLKNLAASNPLHNRAAAAAAGINRPTDSITALRLETKRKKSAEQRVAKNKNAIETMKADARRDLNIAVSDNDDLTEDDSESEPDKQPWAGTSLQSLMAPTARKNLTSLSGLQGIQSSTKAGLQNRPPPTRKHKQANAQQGKRFAPQPKSKPSHRRRSFDDSSSASSSEDVPPTSKPPKTTSTNPFHLAAEDLFHPASSSRKPAALKPAPRISHSHNHDPSTSTAATTTTTADIQQRLAARRERLAAAAAAARNGDGGEGSGNVNVNEIPVFLV